MSDMRQQLLGYLLNAIEPDERAVVEQRLGEDESLRREFDLLRCCLDPLACDPLHHEVPLGLAQRCCEYVYSRVEVMPAALSAAETTVPGRHRRWSWLDLSVAGAIAAAIAILIVPAIYQSHVYSQITQCQKNLSDIGTAQASYVDRHGSYYPATGSGDQWAAARAPVVQLIQDGYIDKRTAVCPTAGAGAEPQIPSLEQLHSLQRDQLLKLFPHLNAVYPSSLPYRDGSKLVEQKDQHRPGFAITSDPPGTEGKNSPNHGQLGQPAHLENGTTPFLKGLVVPGTRDNISTNHEGKVDFPVAPDDSMIYPEEQPKE
jgi:hypothetical protein